MSYLEYWGLKKNPFDSVPDPGMYFSSHSTVENTVAELLFAIEEGNECLAVVVGQVGLGKTMALRVVLDSLDEEKYRIAFITNPDLTFIQILREIIGQLSGEKCTIRAKDALLEEFNRILFETADSDRKVLVFIDEGNAMRPRNLEKLRLLTNMQEDTRNLLTLIIAGQPKLGRMLRHPDRANLFQRIGVYAQLEPLASAEVVRDYIEHRLERAGRSEPIFDHSAFQAIFNHSSGVPRLINRVSKLALKAGETNEFSSIDGEIIRAIASRFESAGGTSKPQPRSAPAPLEKDPAERKESRPSASGKEPEATEPVETEKPRAATAEVEKSTSAASERESQKVVDDELRKARPVAKEAEEPRPATVEAKGPAPAAAGAEKPEQPVAAEPEKPPVAAAGADKAKHDAARNRTEADRTVVRDQQGSPRIPANESRPPAASSSSTPVSRPASHEIHISAQQSRPTLNGSSDHRFSSPIDRGNLGIRPGNPPAPPSAPDASGKRQELKEEPNKEQDPKVSSSGPRRFEPAATKFRPAELTASKPSQSPASEGPARTAAPSPSASPSSARPSSLTAEARRSTSGPTEGRPGIETKTPASPPPASPSQVRTTPSGEKEKPWRPTWERPSAPDREIESSASPKPEAAAPEKSSPPEPRQPSREPAGPEAAAAEVRQESSPKESQAQAQAQPLVGEPSEAEKWDVAKDVLEQLRQISDSKDRLRVAGQMAAREISEHPERYREAHTDPVRIWDELRTQIMRMAL